MSDETHKVPAAVGKGISTMDESIRAQMMRVKQVGETECQFRGHWFEGDTCSRAGCVEKVPAIIGVTTGPTTPIVPLMARDRDAERSRVDALRASTR